MKKVIPIVIVVLVVVVAVIALAGRQSSNNKSSSASSMSNNSSMHSSSSSTSSNAQATDKVTISNFSFSPASITVKKGTTVTWTNQDSVAHTVVETDGKAGPKSQDLGTGQTYSFTYNATGTFAYHCSIHPEMIGSVTVTE